MIDRKLHFTYSKALIRFQNTKKFSALYFVSITNNGYDNCGDYGFNPFISFPSSILGFDIKKLWKLSENNDKHFLIVL